MPTALQFRRGTTAQNNSFTGALGEISIDTQLDTIRVHDGSTAGGFELVQKAATQTLTNKTLALGSNTVSGTTAPFNTALSDGSFATLAGSETLTNKTINASNNTLSNIANSDLSNSSITVTDGSNSTATALGGTITFTAGEGMDVTESSGTVTFAGEDATDSNKGIASFVSADFGVSSGAVSLHDTVVKTVASGSGSATPSSHGFTIAGTANEIETSATGSTVTVGLPDNVTVGGNLTISGNFTVNGTTTTVATTNTTVSDNLLELNSGAGSNANDSGILIERGSTGDNAIMAWDESADKFVVGTTTATNTATGNLTITTGTLLANIEGNITATNVLGTNFKANDGTASFAIADSSGAVTFAGVVTGPSTATLVVKDSSGSALTTIRGV